MNRRDWAFNEEPRSRAASRASFARHPILLLGLVVVWLGAARSATGQGEPPANPPGERILEFPGEHSLGVLYIRYWGATEDYHALQSDPAATGRSFGLSHTNVGWNKLSPALGTVVIPAQSEVRLEFSTFNLRKGLIQLEDLGTLHPDSIQSLDFSAAPIGGRAIRIARRFNTLKELDLSGTGATDGAFAALGDIKTLVSLRFAGTWRFRGPIDGSGLAHLRTLPNLRFLNLQFTQLNDESLAHVGAMTGLTELLISGTKITDDGLRHLAGLESLRRLELGSTTVSGEGLRHLADKNSLWTLGLANTQVDDDALIHLAGLDSLRDLNLGSTAIGDPGLVHLKNLRRLEDLKLGRTQILGPGLVHLARLPLLGRLQLDSTPITDRGLAELGRFSALSNLNLIKSVNITDRGLRGLETATGLQTLMIGGPAITVAGVLRLQNALPSCRVTQISQGIPVRTPLPTPRGVPIS